MPAARFASTAGFALMASDSCAAIAAQIAASCRPIAAAITNDFRRDRAAMLAMAGALELQGPAVAQCDRRWRRRSGSEGRAVCRRGHAT